MDPDLAGYFRVLSVFQGQKPGEYTAIEQVLVRLFASAPACVNPRRRRRRG